MCRYGFKKYKPHFVCFDCRKTFKQPLLEDIIIQNGDWEAYKMAFLEPYTPKREKYRLQHPKIIAHLEEKYSNRKHLCPECRRELFNIGLDFKAPSKHKRKEWEIIRSMYHLGNTFHTCGCSGPGFIPSKKADYLDYLEKVRDSYQKNLLDRNSGVQRDRDYLTFWNDQLRAVELEIKRIKLLTK